MGHKKDPTGFGVKKTPEVMTIYGTQKKTSLGGGCPFFFGRKKNTVLSQSEMSEPRGSLYVVRTIYMVREPCETNHVGEPKNDNQPIRTEPCEPK